VISNLWQRLAFAIAVARVHCSRAFFWGVPLNESQVSDCPEVTSALRHLWTAIELLDDADAPPHIAAHVDLAANQLEALLKRQPAGRGFVKGVN